MLIVSKGEGVELFLVLHLVRSSFRVTAELDARVGVGAGWIDLSDDLAKKLLYALHDEDYRQHCYC